MTVEKMLIEIIAQMCSVEIHPITIGVGVEIWDGEKTYYGRGDTLENALLGAYIDWKAEAK